MDATIGLRHPMVQKGMLTLAGHESDSRIRYLVPTKLTTQYFVKMGQCLDLALRD